VSLSPLPIKQQIRSLCITVTKSLVNYRTYKTTYLWRTFDADAKNGAVTAWLSLLPIQAASMSVMHNNYQVTGKFPYLQDHTSLILRWRSFYYIIHSTSAAVDNCFHPDFTLSVVFLPDWDSAMWQSRVTWLCCTVHFHTTKNDVWCQKNHCACYPSIYKPIFTSYFSPFAHNISLTETLGQATYSWWLIETVCPTFSSLLDFSAFHLHWQSATLLQPVSMTSVSAEPIWAHLAQCSHPAALGLPDPPCHCFAVYRIHRPLWNHLQCHLVYPSRDSS